MLVDQGLMELPQLLEKLTSQPAQILGLDSGTLQTGAAADICLFDPDARWTLTEEESFSKGKNTPFMGYALKGQVTHTLIDGNVVFQR
jgi:dihydroorotase